MRELGPQSLEFPVKFRERFARDCAHRHKVDRFQHFQRIIEFSACFGALPQAVFDSILILGHANFGHLLRPPPPLLSKSDLH
jgi:hypothetical protein